MLTKNVKVEYRIIVTHEPLN